MMATRAMRRALAALALAVAFPAAAHAGPGLAVETRGAWRTLWSADAAPPRWRAADTTLTASLRWRVLAPGVEWAETRLACAAPVWRMRLIVVRIDPARTRLALAMALDPERARPAWSLERAPADAVVAVNAGQFVESMPWGWLVVDGHPRLAPGRGPLSSALAVTRDGAVHWFDGDSLASAPPGCAMAFQSYPTLLTGDGEIPAPLRAGGRGVDLVHRDARLALGLARDGRLLLALTRFDALGETAGAVPLGPTSPEMAAVMGALGAARAMMLDGGISAQLLLRESPGGRVWRWPGHRKVPLALVVRPR
jgi:hypothetical protein